MQHVTIPEVKSENLHPQDNSGTIERDEFLALPQISSNPLATRMIAIFDEDGGGDVDFQEFVSGLSAFSSKGKKEEKLRFAFRVYDIDRDGYISNGELFIVLKMMVGSNLKDQQLQQVIKPLLTHIVEIYNMVDCRQDHHGSRLGPRR